MDERVFRTEIFPLQCEVSLRWHGHQSNHHQSQPWTIKHGRRLIVDEFNMSLKSEPHQWTGWRLSLWWFTWERPGLCSCNTELPLILTRARIQICTHPKTEDRPLKCFIYCNFNQWWRPSGMPGQCHSTGGPMNHYFYSKFVFVFTLETIFSQLATTGCAVWLTFRVHMMACSGATSASNQARGVTDHPVGSITSEWRSCLCAGNRVSELKRWRMV